MAPIEIPGYDIYEQLGRGAMATVYRALHRNLEREVAIKVIDTDRIADRTSYDRFVHGARISAQLSHPHILQIYDVNVYGSLAYISMELLLGGDLGDLIRGAVSQRSIHAMMQQMTGALDYVAARGYVHRDIKPGNIMLRGPDDFVLADFGTARTADSGARMTQADLLERTPGYMSPEQAAGGELDGRSDLYSLAVVCYEMLTGELPFEADPAASVAAKHLTEQPPRLPEHLAAYQPFLDKALARQPEDRFQTGREMYAALCELRRLFDDDEVLNASRDSHPRPAPPPGEIPPGDETELWDLSGDSGSSALSGSVHDSHDELFSGIRNEPRSDRRAVARGGRQRVAALIVVAALLGGAAGGYLYWQSRQPAAPAALQPAATVDTQLEGLLAEAGRAIAGGEFDRARDLLARAAESDPQDPALGRLESELAAKREDSLAQRSGAVERENAQYFDALLAEGRALLARGQLVAAGAKFTAALERAPGHADAGQGLEDTVAALASRAGTAMAEGDFGRARDDLDSALALAPSREDLQQQLAALPAMESERQWRQRLAAARQQLDSGQFAAAAAGFGALLETAPADPAPARAGLQASVDGLLAQARSDLQEQRFDSAGSQLKVARQWLPDDPALAELAAELPRREQAWQAEQAAIAERNARANTQANTVLRAMGDGDLEEARRGYDSLRQEFPAMKVTRDLRERLLNAYREAVREEIEVQSYDTALALITEGQDLAPELALWGELREEVDDLEARDRRRLGAY